PQPGAWIVAVVALRSMPVGADTPDPAECDPPGWTRVGPLEGAAIGGIGVAAIVLQLFVNAPRSPRWDKPILLDQPIQDALRASSPGGRSRAATASDVAGAAFLLYPVVVDAGLVTWLGHGSGNLALRLAAIDVEALAVAGLVTVALQKSVGRVRPFARACAAGSVP